MLPCPLSSYLFKPLNTEDTVYTRFAASAARWPDRPFLNLLPETAEVYRLAPARYSYRQTLAQVEKVAQRYASAGYHGGQRVGLLLENRPDYLFHWLALNSLGVSVVPLNPDLRAAELEYLIAHSEVALLVVIESRVDNISAAVAASGSGAAVTTPNHTLPPSPGRAEPLVANADTECALLYTSGTTGNPKGCVLPNEYFLHTGQWYASAGGLMAVSTDPAEHMLTPLPLFHMNAMACSVMAMVTIGGCLSVLDRFHPSSWWQSVHDSGATIIHYLGVMPSILMSQPASPLDTDHRVRFGFGAGVDAGLHAEFESRHGFPLIEAWAMTETGNGAVIAANIEPREVGSNCLGIPEAALEVRVVGDDGTDAAADENGELLVRRSGDNPRFGFFREYLKDPAATSAAWQDGWFHTGDIVKRNQRGAFYFVDRKKNVIRRSGENIAAVEVESALAQHPYIDQIVVAATPDEIRGDEVLAMIVAASPPADPQQLATDIVSFSLERLAYYKAPGLIAFIDKIPLTATGKIQRGVVKSMAEQLVTDNRCIDTRSLKKRQTP